MKIPRNNYCCPVVAILLSSAALAQKPGLLPARFEAGRVYVHTATSSGPVEFFTDSGGGLVLSLSAAKRLHLQCSQSDPQLKQKLGADAELCRPPLLPGLPPIPAEEQIMAIAHVRQAPSWPDQGDGILGQAWFAGRVWTWDYPGRQLILRPQGWHPAAAVHSAPLFFKQDAAGTRELNFPGIAVKVDGRSLAMLLDTGAETLLTSTAITSLHDGQPAFRATSMIRHSVFEQWHAVHPGWPVIDDAQVGTHSRMIQVPELEVAGLRTGPVWFTERPDANYLQFMSAMMGRPVDGSLGGNALEPFRMTVDYPQARAWFELLPADRSDKHFVSGLKAAVHKSPN